MRVGVLTNLAGQRVGTIVEEDDGSVRGTGKGEGLVEQAPLKTFDDWETTLHFSSYLRFAEGTPDDLEG
jgi:hypothetical protein